MWGRWRRSWASLEKATDRKLRGHFYQLRKATLDALHDVMPKAEQTAGDGGLKGLPGVTKRDLIGQVLFDLRLADGKLIASVGPLLREASRLGGEQTITEAAEARGDDPEQATPFNIEDPRIRELMRARAVRLQGVNRTLRRQVAEQLAEGIQAGETTAELAERVRQRFKFASTRANTIARTEVGAAVEEARSAAREQAGVPLKSWLWSRKETGRRAHAFAEQETTASPIPHDALFNVNGHQCQHPRDASLPVGETANCGCTTLSRYPDDNLKAVLDRYTARGFLTYEALQQRDQGRLATQRKDASHDQDQ